MKHFYILSLLLTFSHAILPMRTTFFGPTEYIDKPRFCRFNLTTVESTAAFNRANKSYNCNKEKVPLLAYRGVEPLLPQFLDSSVPLNTATPLAYGLFKAQYRSLNYTFSWIQNLHESIYFEMSSSVVSDKLQNIALVPTTINGHLLTPEEIDTNLVLQSYLSKLEQKVGTDQERNYIGPSYFLMGYTTSLTNLNYFDFVDISVQTGCIVPIISIDTYQPKFSIFPRQDIINLGIPLQLTVALGVYDWLNVGASGSVISYIKNDQLISLNTAAAANKLLIPSSGLCSVHHEPHLALSAYIEGEYFLPNWTWFFGLSYTKQNSTQYQAQDKQTFPTTIINKYPAQRPWDVACFTLASEFDLLRDPLNVMPRCKLMYTRPFYGTACFASDLLAGQLGLEITYDF